MEFEFTTDMVKATESEGSYYLEGIASTTDTDLQNEALTNDAITRMVKSAIGLPVVTSHNHEFTDEIGSITNAHAENGKLHITAKLDADDPEAMRVFRKISKANGKVGFSIGGKGRGRMVGKSRMIDEVQLQHVMVTSKPVNPNTFAVAISKALAESDTEVKMTLEEMLATDEVKSHIESEIAKAVLSANTKSALKEIHGEAADALLGPVVEAAPNIIIATEVEKSFEEHAANITKAIIDAIKPEIAKLAVSPEPKGSATIDKIVTSEAVSPNLKSLADYLRGGSR